MMLGPMRSAVGLIWAICAVSAVAWAQHAAPQSLPKAAPKTISKATSKPPSPSSTQPVSPIQSLLKAYQVIFISPGKEDLEPASSVSPGDVVEYVAVHRNVSGKRLLNTDFAIPIPYGTTLWQGSVQPENGVLQMPQVTANDVKPNASSQSSSHSSAGQQARGLPRVVWRVARLDPGQRVTLKLRVSIDADPTLAPKPAPNPFRPAQPQLRKPG